MRLWIIYIQRQQIEFKRVIINRTTQTNTSQMSTSHPSSQTPSRQQIKQQQKAFIRSSQQTMQKVSRFLQSRLINAVLQCNSPDCVNHVTKHIDEVHFQTKRFMDTMALGVEKCIEIESNKGIKGYSKCFKMYEYLMGYEVTNATLFKDL